MSSSKEKIFYCVANTQDGLRYTPKALEKDIEHLSYGDGIRYFFPILKILLGKKTLLLNSYRFIDRNIARMGLYLGCKVIILQHGRNEYFESRGPLLLMKKTFTEPRYIYELLFITISNVWFIFIQLKKQSLVAQSSCKLIYFTDNYKNSWIEFLKKLKTTIIVTKVNVPNPITWGTDKPIARIHTLPVFLIDEPLDGTIGLSDEKFFKLINDLSISLKIDKIFTKRHPRSDVKKFVNRANFIETKEVPENVQILIGYKSNLLFCGINADKFYQFNLNSLNEVSTSNLKLSSSAELRDYSEMSKEDYICV